MKIQLADKGAKMPTRADNGSAGYDLYVSEDTIIRAGRNLVPTGLKMAIDQGWEGHIRPRSGFSLKGIEGYRVFYQDNSVKYDEEPSRFDADVIQGTIDSSYTGYIGIIVRSATPLQFLICKGTRLAQIVFSPCYTSELQQVEQLSDTDRGDGGFGHSGTK